MASKPTRLDMTKLPSWGKRFPPADGDRGTPEQREALDKMFSVGRRNTIFGPTSALLRSPQMMLRAQAFSDFVSGFGDPSSKVPANLREIVVLMTGVLWEAEFEVYAHEVMGRAAGLSEDTIEALLAGKRPPKMDATETAVWTFFRELLYDHRVSDETVAAARKALGGDKEIMELVGLSSYYTLVSFSLNIDEMPLPAGAQQRFKKDKSKL
ncbi:AhpD-like protein [Hyaloraphidium curvatum]|nr:AhpD-like protein [Hyaloraphidium curvatum]